MDQNTKEKFCALPTAEELRQSLADTVSESVRNDISRLFDEGTFVEIGTFMKRGYSDFIMTEKMNEFEGVICGYGAIDGKLAFAFCEDAERMGGAIDDRYAKKVADLYRLAKKNGAPVIGLFNSKGVDIFAGTSALAAYGKMMATVSSAVGVIPQIAILNGPCIGTEAAMASLFDFVIRTKDAAFYVTEQDSKDSCDGAFFGEKETCYAFARTLVSFLPASSSEGQFIRSSSDNLGRSLGNIDFGGSSDTTVAQITDNATYYEVFHGENDAVSSYFGFIGGVRCGIVASSFANQEGRIGTKEAKKISKFVGFCSRFSIPVVTLVDSLGLSNVETNQAAFADAIAKLAFAYSSCEVPTVTVICDHAIGASFALLGSKAIGADLVYALDRSEIAALSAESGVAFAWDKYITLDTTRDELVSKWKENVSSPASAANSGEIDDIITVGEMRARICSALLMLSCKGTNAVAPAKFLTI